MRIGSLFSGYGGLDLGVQSVLGGDLAWHCDYDAGPCKVLAHHWPDVPNLHDVTTVDWAAVEPVDVITGGSPCQDVSAAGKRAGMRAGTRSGLWASMCDAVDIIRPSLVVWENVRGAYSAAADSNVEPCPVCLGEGEQVHLRALGRVLGDLAELGYDAWWTGVRAADAGAPHSRFRVFVFAWPAGADATVVGRRAEGRDDGVRAEGLVPFVADADGAGLEGTGGEHGTSGGRQPAGCAAPADSDGPARGKRRLAASGEAEGGRARPDAGGRGRAPAAHTDDAACDRERARPRLDVRGARPAADTDEHEPRRESDERPRGAVAARRRRGAAAHTDCDGQQGVGRLERDPDGRRRADVAWGDYEPAVRRWERVTGRPAPCPTEPGRTGAPRLSPRFVEWMMGLPAGWVTDVPGLSRNEQLKLLGNGVVPQQAALATRQWLIWRARQSAA